MQQVINLRQVYFTALQTETGEGDFSVVLVFQFMVYEDGMTNSRMTNRKDDEKPIEFA